VTSRLNSDWVDRSVPTDARAEPARPENGTASGASVAILDRSSTLEGVREKVVAGVRLDLEDGLLLMESDDGLTLGELADLARRRRGGTDDVYFVQNLYLNQTNVCRVKCKFCAFAVTQKQEGAYTYTAEELVEDALRQRELTGFTEIHMVGGESPHVDFDYYVQIVRQLHEAMPDVHLKLFTASEIHHMSKLSGLSHEDVLRELRDVGLGSLPGGGAEVFADRVRRLVAPGKEHPDEWFDVHRTAHGLGIPTHCTMLYGHVETYAERVDHLLRLRELQDETGGFLAFIPLAFHPENTVFERRGWKHTAASDDLKLIAVSRLLLDNIPNVKAYWIMMGLPLTQIALHFGANDVQGTVVREEIFHAAGAQTETEQKIEELVRVIREAGRVPVQRDTLYNELRRWDE
jgi:aminodeoxyfutalosine synthase